MNFENELEQVFDIDIWKLKPQYSQESSSGLSEEIVDETVIVNDTINITDDRNIVTNELAYCNDIASKKTINIFVDKSFNLSFLKNISEKLFFKSKVNIYFGSSESVDKNGALLINQSEFISKEHNLLSVESKKHILEKLYKYADFKTN